MVSSNLYHSYQSRLEEVQLYYDQELIEISAELIRQILADVQTSDFAEEEKHGFREELADRFQKAFAWLDSPGDGIPTPEPLPQPVEQPDEPSIDPAHAFEYGVALMDSQFWEEAIIEFKRAADLNYQISECLERSGDCCAALEKWDEAIRYYETIYSNPKISEIQKRHLLVKITRCSQSQKKIAAQSSPYAKSGAADPPPLPADVLEDVQESGVETAHSFTSLDHSSVALLVGQTFESWRNEKGGYLTENPTSYRIANVLHLGITSQVLELEEEGTGKRFAGQVMADPFNKSLSAAKLARWVYAQTMIESYHVARVYDMGVVDDHLIVVREHVPASLVDLLSSGQYLPIPLAIFVAYRVLEGLGDLHLHMGKDGQIRNIFHLDLRPSRILLHNRRAVIKVYNGGIWRLLEESKAPEVSIRKLPLSFLAYRAPEQFRPYLARRKPPFFTDIYLFGTLFYEMLTGMPPFRALSYEEYEIQHCDQYPSPPKVWRSEIPSEINETIMKCLEVDPMKRWRSVTQISLILEKAFSQDIQYARNGLFVKYMSQTGTG